MDLVRLDKNRILIKEVFSKGRKQVEIAGWVHNIRDLSKVKFLVLRDNSGIIQITGIKGKTDEKVFKMMDKISRESVIYVKGSVKDSKQAPGGKEINPSEIIVMGEAEKLPIDVSNHSKTELPKRLDYRFLDLHRQRIQAIFKIQGEITNSFREFFYNKGFLEVQLPSVISSSSEGGTELFPIQYFEKKAYLAQSPQLYKQMLACSVENVFTITPVWRAEKHNTVRHLNESRQMDIEMAFANQEVVMKQLEDVVKYIIKQVIKKCKKELDVLEVKLKVPNVKYLSYEDAIKKVGSKFGDDFTPDQEKKLCEMYKDSLVFTYSWPMAIKPFYIMPSGDRLSKGFDTLYKGVEISSGGQRIHMPELIEKRLKAKGLNPKNFKSYIDSFRFGAPPHAGWSIGLERLTQLIVGEKNIREACLFPRDRDRLVP